MRARWALIMLALVTGIAVGADADDQRGLDPRNLDTSVAACADFYRYANGNWLRHNPIPPAYSSWGVGNELSERNLKLLKEILEASAKQKAAPGSTAQKIGDFYASGMDEAGIEKAGIAPLRRYLDQVDALQENTQVLTVVEQWHALGFTTLFSFGAFPDLKHSTTTIAYAGQGGIGMPDRDYYLRSDAESQALRARYQAHVARTLRLVGATPEQAIQESAWIVALETRMAKASLGKQALRDPANFYHIVSIAKAQAQTPHIPWQRYFAALDVGQVEEFSLAHPAFFTEIDRMLVEVPIAQWRAYLRWSIASETARYLSKAMVAEDFEFNGKTLRGTRELRPRWKRVMEATSAGLGEALGELYVARAFSPAAKTQVAAMVDGLRGALKARIERLDWMSAATKAKALEKLATFRAKIGYPDRWRDYAPLAIGRHSYLENVVAANAFETRRQLVRIGKPVDRDEWEMTPQTVNAYYNPLLNEIVFPAAILQPPFFDPDADDAVNYGAMGAVIGHEIIHGYDDQGSKFDAEGNLRSWWTEADRAAFDQRTARLAAQFDAYVAVGTLHVDGKLTLGENLADFGGLQIAYDAFRHATHERLPAPIAGMTGDQRFFLAWAQSWRRNYSPQALKLMINTDAHAPSGFRVNGPLSNFGAFADAFGCKPGDAMVNPAERRVAIW